MAGYNHNGPITRCGSRTRARELLKSKTVEQVYKLVKNWQESNKEAPCFICSYCKEYSCTAARLTGKLEDHCDEGIKQELDKVARQVNPDYKINKVKAIVGQTERGLKTIRFCRQGQEAETNEKAYAYELIKRELGGGKNGK